MTLLDRLGRTNSRNELIRVPCQTLNPKYGNGGAECDSNVPHDPS